MRSTFWPNRIFERQSSQNLHTGLKFSPNRKNSALSMKIVQNALFRSCAPRFGQIAFLSMKVLKIVTLAWNSLRNRKAVRFPWKLYKTLFSGHAQHVLANSQFWALKFSKSSQWPEIVFETGKQCAFHENCTKRSFQVMRSTFWPNPICERQSSQNRETGLKLVQKGKTVCFLFNCTKRSFQVMRSTFWPNRNFERESSQNRHSGLKFSPKRENGALFLKNCTKRSFQVMRSTFWPNRIFERQSSQNRHTGLKFSSKRENSALFIKIVQNALFRSSPARFGQIAFLGVKVLKIVTLAWNSLQKGKTVRFL